MTRERTVLLVVHTGREEATETANQEMNDVFASG